MYLLCVDGDKIFWFEPRWEIDMTNEVGCNGRFCFPEFCKIVLRKYREDSKDLFNKALFKVKN